MSGQLPQEGEPGAAFGVPLAGDAWAAGHAADGYQVAHGGPVAPGEWGAAPAGAQPWEPAPAGTWEHAGAGGYTPPGATQEWPQPHTHAEPHPYPQAQPPHPQPYPQAQGGGEPGSHPRTAVRPAAHGVPERPRTPPARTGSPITPPGIEPAAITAALGLLLAGGAALGKPALAAALVVLQALTAAGWFRLNGMWPARQGILLAFLSGVTADTALLAVNGEHGPAALLGTLGAWLLLVLVLQLRHHGSADERLSALTATSVSTLLTVVAAGYLATATSHAGTDPVVIAGFAVAVAVLVRALPLPGGPPVSLVLALLAATASAAVTASLTGTGTGHTALIAAACGACALIGLRVASYDFPSRFVHFTAGVALPLTAAAPVLYLLGRALA